MSLFYRTSMNTIGKIVPNRLQPLWKHPAGKVCDYIARGHGPQTIFFWGPVFKWGLVIAGLGDMRRPASELSIRQSSALALTGFIWTRYSMVIIPKNYALFSVNFFVACTALYQVSRAVIYQREEAAKEAAALKIV